MEDSTKERFLDPATGLTIVTLIDIVCRHPEWYTLDRTFAEAVAYLNRFYQALEFRKAAPEQVAEWLDFCGWMAERLGLEHPDHFRRPAALPRTHLFERLRQGQPDDQAALQRLDDWWSEFWSVRRRS